MHIMHIHDVYKNLEPFKSYIKEKIMKISLSLEVSKLHIAYNDGSV